MWLYWFDRIGQIECNIISICTKLVHLNINLWQHVSFEVLIYIPLLSFNLIVTFIVFFVCNCEVVNISVDKLSFFATWKFYPIQMALIWLNSCRNIASNKSNSMKSRNMRCNLDKLWCFGQMLTNYYYLSLQ